MFNRKPASRQTIRKKSTKKKYRKSIKSIKLLIEMRKKAGITTNGLADLASLDPKNYWRLEKGIARNPGRDTLIRLARALVRYTKMFDESDVDKVLAAANFPPAPEPECNHHCYRHAGYGIR